MTEEEYEVMLFGNIVVQDVTPEPLAEFGTVGVPYGVPKMTNHITWCALASRNTIEKTKGYAGCWESWKVYTGAYPQRFSRL